MNSTFFFNAFTSYFVVMDPIGCALVFYSLTIGQSLKQKAKTIVASMFIAFSIIVMFGLFGEGLLTTLGISMDALRVAGGLLLFNTAFRMITSEPSHEQPHDVRIGHITVYPLAIPMTAGPGTLTLTVLLVADGQTYIDQAFVLLAALISLTLTVVLALLSSHLRKLLGKNWR